MNENLTNVTQKSTEMETIYQVSSDPWGNGERKLYECILGDTAMKIEKLLRDKGINLSDSLWFDIGCGGGNVTRGFKENLSSIPRYKGCDISKSALSTINDLYEETYCLDLDKVSAEEAPWKEADVLTLIEVLYYTGLQRPWKQNADMIVESMKQGALLIVADGLVRNQYRDYLKRSDRVSLVDEYTIPTPICEEKSSSGRVWHRYLKVRIYERI